jgi:hypothetical protein
VIVPSGDIDGRNASELSPVNGNFAVTISSDTLEEIVDDTLIEVK